MAENTMKERNVYLRKLLNGEIQGPLTGKPSIDKPHLLKYPEEYLLKDFPKMKMYDYLYLLNKDHMDEIAIIFDTGFSETPITYKELFQNIDVVAKSFIKKGIKAGDRVALSLLNIPESAYAIYALNKIGAVVCLIDPTSNEFNLKRDIQDLDVKMFVGINEQAKLMRHISKEINFNNYVLVPMVNSSNKRIVKFSYNFKKLKEGNFVYKLNKKWSNFINDHSKINDINLHNYKSDELAIISFTGGTTGVHKGVELSNDSLNTLVFSHVPLMGNIIKRGDKFMNILPQFMIYGIFTLHLALCWGLETHMMLDPSSDKFVDNLIKINPVMAFGGPVHWETLINNAKLKPNTLSNMLAPISGGEKLPLSQAKAISEALIKAGSHEKICDGFGASELGGSVTINYGSDCKEGTVGKLHIYDNAKVVDINTWEELPYGKEGRLLITTPSLMLGYHNRPEEEKISIVEENGVRWFNTGDLAKIYQNGDIEITGRIKRLFVCGLNNVYPPELEEIINQIPNIRKCAVVNVPDPIMREVPKVHVVLENDNELEREKAKNRIIEEISNKVRSDVVPKYFEFHSDLKYTANGKIDFNGIRNDDLQKMEYESSKKLVKR